MVQTVPEILVTLSRELRYLAERTSALQDQLSSGAYARLDVEACQDLDSVTQTLGCLATYVARLGALVPCRRAMEIGEAVDLVCLAALAERLRGDRPAARAATSEIELF